MQGSAHTPCLNEPTISPQGIPDILGYNAFNPRPDCHFGARHYLRLDSANLRDNPGQITFGRTRGKAMSIQAPIMHLATRKLDYHSQLPLPKRQIPYRYNWPSGVIWLAKEDSGCHQTNYSAGFQLRVGKGPSDRGSLSQGPDGTTYLGAR